MSESNDRGARIRKRMAVDRSNDSREYSRWLKASCRKNISKEGIEDRVHQASRPRCDDEKERTQQDGTRGETIYLPTKAANGPSQAKTQSPRQSPPRVLRYMLNRGNSDTMNNGIALEVGPRTPVSKSSFGYAWFEDGASRYRSGAGQLCSTTCFMLWHGGGSSILCLL